MSQQAIYQDPNFTISERVENLMSQMTLKEKIGQMCQLDAQNDPEKWIAEYHVGSFLHTLGNLNNQLQDKAAKSRLGIPLIFGIDAIHGHAFWPTATVFPTQLGLSSSWNPEIVRQVGRITAKEVSVTGAHWTFSPVLGTARDLRWGRVNETFGEDPYLIGELGAAIIEGYQGDDLSDPDTILACAKHFAGYSETRGGRDSTEADHSERMMRSIFLKPFHEAAKAGCATYMAGYQAIDGIPCSANRWLLTEVLRDEWEFDGFVVSDWNNIGWLHQIQGISPTMDDAVRRAIEAGNDMAMATPEFCETALRMVENGELAQSHIDDACRRILALKFELGLFDENRYTDLDKIDTVVGSDEHREVALEAAYQSIVLLKNDDNLLPLKDDLKSIAVIGPNADDIKAQLGDWVSWEKRGSADGSKRPREIISTVLDGVKARAGEKCEVVYERGCAVANPDDADIESAVKAAKDADVAILVVGDDTTLNGEWRDRANLDLSGAQEALVKAVHETGTPVVVVLINGKPLSIPWIAENVPAIVEAWNPGMAGGEAVAGILFGDRAPEGKLTISFPHHVGQLPVYYNQNPGWHGGKYVDMPETPLYAFGYGLSYTTFEYDKLKLSSETLKDDETLIVQVDVKNTGKRAGTEIVQLYINDVFTSVTTPSKELKAFARVTLDPGKKQTVKLEVPFERLALVDADWDTVVEPGEFEVMVGPSSRDEVLLKAKFTVVE